MVAVTKEPTWSEVFKWFDPVWACNMKKKVGALRSMEMTQNEMAHEEPRRPPLADPLARLTTSGHPWLQILLGSEGGGGAAAGGGGEWWGMVGGGSGDGRWLRWW